MRKKIIESEIGTIRKSWKGCVRVALVYPNTYYVGMSNLGFQTVYYLLNAMERVVCERCFLPEKDEFSTNSIITVESGKSISDFDVIAFSISFEQDYSNVLTILQSAKLALHSVDRKNHPLVIAGGVACFLNPEPIAPFIDCFLLGEAEPILPLLFDSSLCDLLLNADKKSYLETLAKSVPSAYIPAFYKTTYNVDGTICSFEPLCDAPLKVERVFVKDIANISTHSAVLTPHTTFKRTFLIEVSRGCPHGCRFCGAGFIYRPPRFRALPILKQCVERGALLTNKIGLVGAAISDLPEIDQLCDYARQQNVKISFSSLRADAITPELLLALKQSDIKTATIAPDAGSERMRKVINKGLTEENILNAATELVASGILNLKLYFMVGLPTETMEDIEAIINLCKKIKRVFLKASRIKKRIGKIIISLNCFVPKPFTPFQWTAMDDVKLLKTKMKKIINGLKGTPNIRIHASSPRLDYIQALFSRGDRRVAEILRIANQNNENWTQTFKQVSVNPDFYVTRERFSNELFPWDFIQHGINKDFLKQEYQKAKQGKTSPPCKMQSCNICGVCK